MRPSGIAVTASVVVVASAGVTANSADAAAIPPGVVVDYAHHTVTVRPVAIRPFKDLSFSGIRWTALTASTGQASAVQHVNRCIPDCAAANYEHTRVELSFTKVELSDCRTVFTRVRVTAPPSRDTRTYPLPSYPSPYCP